MIAKDTAIEIQQYALRAVEALHDAVTLALNNCEEQDFAIIRRGAGSAIGRIQMEILEVIYSQYPDLDHLKES